MMLFYTAIIESIQTCSITIWYSALENGERNDVGPGVVTAEPADTTYRSLERNNMADEAAFQFLHNEVIQYIYKSAESGETENGRHIAKLENMGFRDNTFRLLSQLSAGKQYLEHAPKYLSFSCGLVRGALSSLGVKSIVTAEVSIMPACKFQIMIQKITRITDKLKDGEPCAAALWTLLDMVKVEELSVLCLQGDRGTVNFKLARVRALKHHPEHPVLQSLSSFPESPCHCRDEIAVGLAHKVLVCRPNPSYQDHQSQFKPWHQGEGGRISVQVAVFPHHFIVKLLIDLPWCAGGVGEVATVASEDRSQHGGGAMDVALYAWCCGV
ncbi:hypothetical protein FQN60_002227 [Etheostoma spectabile]|uniref:Trafficking protein particle complex subunit 6B n=1 Tax=Etheostoma spectabile TaxID=54343 RepID=A0A5J5DC46_9PERO|nr:hypothetical protein FQN60_002227 [Etheostoma spectabile]